MPDKRAVDDVLGADTSAPEVGHLASSLGHEVTINSCCQPEFCGVNIWRPMPAFEGATALSEWKEVVWDEFVKGIRRRSSVASHALFDDRPLAWVR